MKRGILFDMDGVLIDSYRAHWLSWVDTCGRRGIPITKDLYAMLFGRPFRGFVEALCDAPLSEEDFTTWYRDKELVYREIIESDFPEVPGASELIHALDAEGYRIGIATSGPRENVNCLLRLLPGAHLVKATVSADEVERNKPHPDVFLACARELGVPPEACVVIEDSIHGLAGARAAGMGTIALTGTCAAEQLHGQADLVVDCLTKLAPAHVESVIPLLN